MLENIGIRLAISHLFRYRTTYIFLIVFLTSFLVRVAYLLDYQGSPFFHSPIVDAQFHDNWAKDIVEGDIFSLKQGEVLYKAPLYPYFMASVYCIFGHNFFILRTIQILIGSLSCSILFLIALYYTNHRYAVIGALLYSLYFVSIYFDNEIEIPCIGIFLTLLSFLLVKKAHNKSCLIFSAVSLGLSVIALPSNLLLLPYF